MLLTMSCAGKEINSPDNFCLLYKPFSLTDAVIAVMERPAKVAHAANTNTYLRRCKES